MDMHDSNVLGFKCVCLFCKFSSWDIDSVWEE